MKRSKKLTVTLLILPFFLLIGLLFFLLKGNPIPNNPKERNRIILKATNKEVYDSIIAILPYLKKVPAYNADWMNYLVSDSNELYLNFKNIGKIQELLLTDNKELDFLTKNEKNRFLNLTLFLNNNYLFRCNFFKSTTYVEYVYRNFKDAGDYHSDLLRFITLDKSLHSLDKNRYQVLDVSDNLILYSYKDAKIWEGEKQK